MGIQDRKERESGELRQKILDAALQVFANEGYERVSMRKIAALIDYSPTTIYRFFQNKEELLWAIAAGTYGELSASFAKVKAAGGGPLVTLRALIREYMIFCVVHPDMFKLFSDLSSFELEDGVLYERLGKGRQMVYQSWFGCIRKAIEFDLLKIKDDLRVFLFLWDAVDGYIDHRIRHPGVPRKPVAADSVDFLELLFSGLETRSSQEAPEKSRRKKS